MAAWRLRRSTSFGPLRLTATTHGLALSAGGPFGRVSVNSRGEVRQTTRVPGVGIYKTQKVAQLGHPHSDHECDHPHPAAAALPPPSPPAAWYPDPHDAHSWRYWDGARWTDHTAPR
jgi:hypothetical protein